jgi:hypothetical protein
MNSRLVSALSIFFTGLIASGARGVVRRATRVETQLDRSRQKYKTPKGAKSNDFAPFGV